MLEAAAGDHLLVAMGVSNVAAHDPEDAGAEDVAIVGVGALEPSANTDADDCLSARLIRHHPVEHWCHVDNTEQEADYVGGCACQLSVWEYHPQDPRYRYHHHHPRHPALNLDNNAGGCALFFEGVSANFTVPQDKKNTFTCSNALNADCVPDLMCQTESAAKLAGDSNACRRQLGRSLTGDKALETADQNQCRTITGQGYDLYFVDSERHYLADHTQKALSQVLMGIIPVITVLETDGKTKAELTCLRLVDSVANQTDDESRPKSLGSPNGVLFSPSMYLATMLVSITLYVL
ncbi:hypothetical protein PG987_012431 [Apiospora arundinis]